MNGIRKLTAVVALLLSFVAYASGPTRHFEDFANKEGAEYSYVSPLMIKAKSCVRFSSRESGRSTFLTEKEVSMVESVTVTDMTDIKKLDEMTAKIIRNNNMELFVSSRKPRLRYEVYGNFSGDQKRAEKLLVIRYEVDESFSAVYMEGSINLQGFGYVLSPRQM